MTVVELVRDALVSSLREFIFYNKNALYSMEAIRDTAFYGKSSP